MWPAFPLFDITFPNYVRWVLLLIMHYSLFWICGAINLIALEFDGRFLSEKSLGNTTHNSLFSMSRRVFRSRWCWSSPLAFYYIILNLDLDVAPRVRYSSLLYDGLFYFNFPKWIKEWFHSFIVFISISFVLRSHGICLVVLPHYIQLLGEFIFVSCALQ